MLTYVHALMYMYVIYSRLHYDFRSRKVLKSITTSGSLCCSRMDGVRQHYCYGYYSEYVIVFKCKCLVGLLGNPTYSYITYQYTVLVLLHMYFHMYYLSRVLYLS